MLKKTLIATGIVVAISGCSITPNKLNSASIAETVQGDMELLARDQAVAGSIDLNEAIARAVLNNRDKKLKEMEAALAQGQIELVQKEMLPELTAAAGYSRRSNYAASASVNFEDGEPESLGSDPAYSVSQNKERHSESIAFTWDVLDFGLSYVRAKQSADRYLIARERERKVVHNITQDVRASYWRAVSAERLLAKINPLIGQADQALQDSRAVESQRLKSPLEALYYQRELADQ